MSIRIRQIALCTDDIWPVERQLVAELGIAGVHRDPPNQFEMRNTVFCVGDTFLEVLQPTAPTAPSARFLDKHGGPGGYMLILQVDDLDTAKAHVDDLGIRVVFHAPMTKTHGIEAGALHLHPADTGGTLISLDQMVPAEGWAWAGRAWEGHRHTDVVDAIVGVELTTSDPGTLAKRLGQLFDRTPADDHTITLDAGDHIRFETGPAGARDQLTAVDLRATERSRAGESIVAAGTTLNLV